jgi:thymidylate kinase
MEQQPTAFHRTVRDTFLQLANDDSRRIRLIDGSRKKDEVAADVWNAIADLLR